MPTYEYQCVNCDHRFERFQWMSERPIRSCPLCRRKVKRLVGAGAGFLFKGNGFYVTDHRSESYHKAAQAERER